MHDPVFERFERVTTVGTGAHMHDFIGGLTKVSYKSDWAKHAAPVGAPMKPGYPPVNEHYLDWIATLQAVDKARGTFRMAELGAGWAPWLVRGALAARQRPDISRIELLGVEADPQHFDWMQDHLRDNGLDPAEHGMLFGAASDTSQTLRFPIVDNPDVNYGASLREIWMAEQPHIEVPGITLERVLKHFSGPVDFMHVDIQGAEYDLIPAGMGLLKSNVKTVMVGTHLGNDRHGALAQLFRETGWDEAMNFNRNALSATPYGDIQFGDGFLLFTNSAF